MANAATLWNGLTRFGRAALDLALPPQCPTCDAAVPQPGLFCPACFSGLRFVTAPFCARCGEPFPATGLGPLCAPCAAAPPSFSSARAALRYDDAAQRLLLPFKHADRTELARPLARLMARQGRDLLARADALVPVPIHRWRLVRRRYNQAALLASALSAVARRPVWHDVLRRVRATPALGGLGAAARRTTVAGVFAAAHADRLVGRRLLLVDDVMTSGATADAAASCLLRAGAARVDVLVAARVPHPSMAS